MSSPHPAHPLRLLFTVLLTGLLAPSTQAQSLADLRTQLRADLGDAHFAKSLIGLVGLSEDLELSGANYDVNDDADTEITAITLPFSRVFPLAGSAPDTQPLAGTPPATLGLTGLYVEGVLGYARAEQSVADIYTGTAPALATGIDTDLTTVGGLIGVGPQLQLAPGLTFTPILNLGLAYLENDTDYRGPGAAFTAALADGIAFNWEAWIGSVGVAGRVEYIRPFAGGYELTLVGRYDLRYSETFAEDDPAQRFTALSQLLTARADLTGPVSFTLFNRSLRWRATFAYREFLEGDLYTVDRLIQFGGGFETSDRLPFGTTLSVSGAAILGDDVTGYAVGIGLSF